MQIAVTKKLCIRNVEHCFVSGTFPNLIASHNSNKKLREKRSKEFQVFGARNSKSLGLAHYIKEDIQRHAFIAHLRITGSFFYKLLFFFFNIVFLILPSSLQ